MCVWFSQVREEPQRREWWTHSGRRGDAENRAGTDGLFPGDGEQAARLRETLHKVTPAVLGQQSSLCRCGRLRKRARGSMRCARLQQAPWRPSKGRWDNEKG